jgi:hypothetical protein
MPVTLQTLAMRTRQRPFFERARRRYGPLFTVRVHGLGPTVGVADPQLIKQTFKADPTVLHAGTASPLRELLGDNSLLGIDEAQHMEQRKLLLPPPEAPAFRGIVWAPARGGRLVMRRRAVAPARVGARASLGSKLTTGGQPHEVRCEVFGAWAASHSRQASSVLAQAFALAQSACPAPGRDLP